MHFSTKEDIEAPIDQVFRMVSDFEGLERSALRRGAEVKRTGAEAKGVGMAWDVAFQFRGRGREMHLEIVEYEPPTRIVCRAASDGLEVPVTVELVALSKRRTRMSLDVELKPGSLSARLLVQSLKLARSNINRRFHLRVAEYARDMEERLQRHA